MSARSSVWSVVGLGVTLCSLVGLPAIRAQTKNPSPAAARVAEERLSDWAFFAEVNLPSKVESEWVDFVLPPYLFAAARNDLRDLRLYTTDGKEVPFALRVRKEQDRKEPFKARELNRTQGPDGSSELTLDLERANARHNELELELPGDEYRRKVELEGSDDGNAWRPMHSQFAISFQRGDEMLRDESIPYPPSRYRYLRIRVFQDPQVDEEPVQIGKAAAIRRVLVPGEPMSLAAQMGRFEKGRDQGAYSSSWILNLGADRTPVHRLEVTIDDRDFVRNYRIEAGGPQGSSQKFRTVANGVWRRRGDDEVEPMVANFNEVRAARLRLTLIDNRNDPLQIKSVVYSAPARQVVFAAPNPGRTLRLYYGNTEAENPAYDFDRNLPDRLEPKPGRATLGPQTDNPVYVPIPKPWTERLPWLIYIVLGAAILVLGFILVSLSRVAIQAHDLASEEARADGVRSL
ncbi:MAG: DUF3999 family protein [Pirellulaceae bacterium]